MNLESLGWTQNRSDSFASYKEKGLQPARVVRRDRTAWLIATQTGETLADVTGRFRSEVDGEGNWPAVGDWVAVTINDGGLASIHAVLDRETCISRKAAGERTDQQVLAANVDTAFLVAGLDLDFNLRRLERYLATVYDSGATPVILLNKADLCDNLDEVISEVESIAFGVDILAISAVQREGLEQLEPYVGPGQTVIVLGSSGVGKSTLINSLAGSDELKTGEVREDDSRGRHTTTWRELVVLPEGGVLIDTPGMRELANWLDQDGLERAFDDIERLTPHCRFRDCTHQGEPGCAVEQAIDNGELPAERLKSYLKLKREAQKLEERRSGKAEHLQRLRGKKFARMVKEVNKYKQRNR